jgi:hypothetical protein
MQMLLIWLSKGSKITTLASKKIILMKKSSIPFLLAFLLLQVQCDTHSQYPDTFSQEYFEMVDAEFDEESAFETVAYIEQYFRVVGNEGFNNSIHYVEEKLKNAGFVEESTADESDRLTYRVEHRPLERPSWQPVEGSLTIAGEEVLTYETNRNFMAINSFSTSGAEEFEVVNVGSGRELNFDENVEGKVVFAETSVGYLFREAVLQRGAAGVLAYRMPSYTNPEVNQTSIQFSGITYDDDVKSWGLLLSYEAKEKLLKALEAGDNTIQVDLNTEFVESDELTIVAELNGSTYTEDRFVFSAHVQEPGANDNASGVGVLAEVASTSARLFKENKIDPERTITYLFGDEIVSTNRYIQEDSVRAKNIKWGMSLDMVGEDTEKTGGTFLIEKMPDPGAIWTRGEEQHTEWGGRPLSKEEMTPHYFNDFILHRFQEQGEAKDWVVKTNPFEGGSDHVPFLRADIPGLLLWHFTDQFYHTSNDRIDKVSKSTLKNVGTGALVSALILTSDQNEVAGFLLNETRNAAIERLNVEFELSKAALEEGGSPDEEQDIIAAWTDWYIKALESTNDVLTSPSDSFMKEIQSAVTEVKQERDRLTGLLK